MKEIENVLTEVLGQAIEFRKDYLSNEQAVRTQLIEPILNSLGWRTSNPKFVRPNAPDEDGKIPDYTLVKNGKTTLIVEAKNLSIDLQNKSIIDQLANYCFKSGIDFGVLTNGVKWLLFKTFEKNPADRIVWQVDLENDKIDFVARNLYSFAFINIDTLDSLLKKSKQLDNGWKSLVQNTDSVIDIISQKLLEKIKTHDSTFRIDQTDLKTFTKGKIEELFEFSEIEEEDNEIEDKNILKQNESETLFSDVEDSIFKRHQKNKIREKIAVTFPDKTEIRNKKVVDTFVETIKKIGPEKVKGLEMFRSGVPIVSDVKDTYYNQHKIDRFYVMVHTSTKEKMSILKEINERLKLNLKFEIFLAEK